MARRTSEQVAQSIGMQPVGALRAGEVVRRASELLDEIDRLLEDQPHEVGSTAVAGEAEISGLPTDPDPRAHNELYLEFKKDEF